MSKKIYSNRIEEFENIAKDLNCFSNTFTKGQLWSYYEYPEEFAKIMDEFFE